MGLLSYMVGCSSGPPVVQRVSGSFMGVIERGESDRLRRTGPMFAEIIE